MSQQAEFAAALFDPTRPCPGGLKTWNGSDPAARLAVYRNNVVVSLVDALGKTFPVVQALVGEEFFRAMARLHVRAAPPRTRILAHYGADFPTFVAGFAPAAGLPYLADVARLEWLRVRACHAADAPVADSAALVALLGDPERLSGLRLVLQPALALLRSPFAIVSLWAAHQGALDIAQIDPGRAENALVLRHGLEVEVIGLMPGEVLFVARLQEGASLGQAAGEATARHPDLDMAAPLAQLLRAGAISQFSLDHGGPRA
ncbi:MAG: DNA-binding domain-containing protein [Pseudomonas sp.]|nr:DNA-binding domain-containing protein [Pseudomonas sp.]